MPTPASVKLSCGLNARSARLDTWVYSACHAAARPSGPSAPTVKRPAVAVSLPVLVPEVVQGKLGVEGGAAERAPAHIRAEEDVAPVTQADGVGQIVE